MFPGLVACRALGAGESRERCAGSLASVSRVGALTSEKLNRPEAGFRLSRGEVAEWTIAAVSKTVVSVTPAPGVRIPPSPHRAAKIFRAPVERAPANLYTLASVRPARRAWQSGLMRRSFGIVVPVLPAPEVQILPSPLSGPAAVPAPGFVFSYVLFPTFPVREPLSVGLYDAGYARTYHSIRP